MQSKPDPEPDRKPAVFDLSEVARGPRIDLPNGEPVELDIYGTDFLTWLDRGERRKRWDEPERFVRDLLSERSAESERAITVERVSELDAVQIEAAALDILEKSGRLHVPRAVEEKGTGRMRARAPDDPDPLVPLPDETNAARLLRVLKGYGAYHRARTQRMLEDARRMVDPLGTALGHVRRDGLLQQHWKQLGLGTAGSALLEQRRRMNEHLLTGKGFEDRIGAAIDEVVGRRSIASGLLGGNSFPLGSGVHESMAGKAFRESLDAAIANLAGTRPIGAGLSQARVFGEVIGSFRHIDDLSRLGIPRDTWDVLRGRGVPRGFEAAAGLAMGGLTAPGATADLLRDYERRAAHGPVFNSVLDALQGFDADDMAPGRFQALVQSAMALLKGAPRDRKDPVDLAARYALLALLVAIVTLAEAVYADFGPPAIATERRENEQTELMKSFAADSKALRDDRQAAKHIRYVHDVVNLRAEPHRQGQLIRYVYPDQPVRIIEIRDAWAKVEVFDYPSDTPIRGWINRRHLRASPL